MQPACSRDAPLSPASGGQASSYWQRRVGSPPPTAPARRRQWPTARGARQGGERPAREALAGSGGNKSASRTSAACSLPRLPGAAFRRHRQRRNGGQGRESERHTFPAGAENRPRRRGAGMGLHQSAQNVLPGEPAVGQARVGVLRPRRSGARRSRRRPGRARPACCKAWAALPSGVAVSRGTSRQSALYSSLPSQLWASMTRLGRSRRAARATARVSG